MAFHGNPYGRGAQVLLDGDAMRAARGAYGSSMSANAALKAQLEAAGLVGDGSTPDGSSITGTPAEDILLGGGAEYVDARYTDTAAYISDRIYSAMAEGNTLIFRPGVYVMRTPVAIDVTTTLRVLFQPGAHFTMPDLDGDCLRFTGPSTMPTLADGVDLIIEGGFFDQSLQKISTSVPFNNPVGSPYYARSNIGTSATCGAISVRGRFRRASIRNGAFTCGTHWRNAGGDQSIYIAQGSYSAEVSGCTFEGNPDVAIYGSRDSAGTIGVNLSITNCWFRNCAYGASVKRGFKSFTFSQNYVENCLIGLMTNHAGVGGRVEGGTIEGNFITGTMVGVRVDYATAVKVSNNHISSMGAYMDDGTTQPPYATGGSGVLGLIGVTVNGSELCEIVDNTIDGVKYDQGNSFGVEIQDFTSSDVGTVFSTHNLVARNIMRSLHGIGHEQGSSDYSRFERNEPISCEINTIPVVGTNTETELFEPTTHRNYSVTGMLFGDGTSTAPIIARGGGTTTGIYFETSRVGISAPLKRSNSSSLASAGTTQAGATAITNQWSRFSTVTAGGGGRLLTGVVGVEQVVFNDTATDLLIYPATGDKINALATNAAYTLTAGSCMTFRCMIATRITATV